MGAVTVSANDLSVVHKNSDGKAMATIPDVCITPFPSPPGPLPLPYPNIAESKKLNLGSILTKIDGANVALLGSEISQTAGDETGSIGGVVSGQTKGKGMFLNSSPNVTIEMRPVCRKSDMMLMNMINTIAMSGMNQADVNVSGTLEQEAFDVEIELLDAEGNPRADEDYKITHSGAVLASGKTDSSGQAKVEGITKSGYRVDFPNRTTMGKKGENPA